MQIASDDVDDPDARAEVSAFGLWTDTLASWSASPPIVVFATTADGTPLARRLDDLDADPTVWRGAEADMSDPATFLPVSLSDIGDTTPIDPPRTYSTILEWYQSEIDPNLHYGT